jgi:hypothetical protein
MSEDPTNAAAWRVIVTRPHPHVTLFEVSLSDYREFISVIEGENSIAVTMIEPEAASYTEPQLFAFAKPYGWRSDLPDQEALIQTWQTIGVQR